MDVTVIGGGVFGLSVAYACASRGATVRLYERKAIGSGASGGLVGALAPHVPENWNPKKAFQLESLLMAREANVVVDDPLFATALRTRLESAIAEGGRQLDAGAYLKRPWHLRAREALASAAMRTGLFLIGRRY